VGRGDAGATAAERTQTAPGGFSRNVSEGHSRARVSD
jgi:hypothetical protein